MKKIEPKLILIILSIFILFTTFNIIANNSEYKILQKELKELNITDYSDSNLFVRFKTLEDMKKLKTTKTNELEMN